MIRTLLLIVLLGLLINGPAVSAGLGSTTTLVPVKKLPNKPVVKKPVSINLTGFSSASRTKKDGKQTVKKVISKPDKKVGKIATPIKITKTKIPTTKVGKPAKKTQKSPQTINVTTNKPADVGFGSKTKTTGIKTLPKKHSTMIIPLVKLPTIIRATSLLNSNQNVGIANGSSGNSRTKTTQNSLFPTLGSLQLAPLKNTSSKSKSAITLGLIDSSANKVKTGANNNLRATPKIVFGNNIPVSEIGETQSNNSNNAGASLFGKALRKRKDSTKSNNQPTRSTSGFSSGTGIVTDTGVEATRRKLLNEPTQAKDKQNQTEEKQKVFVDSRQMEEDAEAERNALPSSDGPLEIPDQLNPAPLGVGLAEKTVEQVQPELGTSGGPGIEGLTGFGRTRNGTAGQTNPLAGIPGAGNIGGHGVQGGGPQSQSGAGGIDLGFSGSAGPDAPGSASTGNSQVLTPFRQRRDNGFVDNRAGMGFGTNQAYKDLLEKGFDDQEDGVATQGARSGIVNLVVGGAVDSATKTIDYVGAGLEAVGLGSVVEEVSETGGSVWGGVKDGAGWIWENSGGDFVNDYLEAVGDAAGDIVGALVTGGVDIEDDDSPPPDDSCNVGDCADGSTSGGGDDSTPNPDAVSPEGQRLARQFLDDMDGDKTSPGPNGGRTNPGAGDSEQVQIVAQNGAINKVNNNDSNNGAVDWGEDGKPRDQPQQEPGSALGPGGGRINPTPDRS